MAHTLSLVVTSPSFCKNQWLRQELETHFSNIKYNDEGLLLKGAELVTFIGSATAAIIGTERLPRDLLAQMPRLRMISKYGVGTDNLDLVAMKDLGIHLGWTGGVNARSVTELTLTFALGLMRNVFVSHERLRQGVWKKEGGQELTGKTVGIVGCGYIGQDVARLLRFLGCRVLIHDIENRDSFCSEIGAQAVGKNQLFSESDLVTLHIPYGPETDGYVGHAELALMKRGALLINTSRGRIVREDALYQSLESGHLAGAALDVYAEEPCLDNPLLRLPQFIGTPHIGGNSGEAVKAMGTSAINHLIEFSKTWRPSAS